MNLLIRRGTTCARVNWGRWVGDCASPACRSAVWLSTGQPSFVCWDCGEPVEVVWPEAPFVAGIERLLSMRSEPWTRNWDADESLHDLLAENMRHGVLPAPRKYLDERLAAGDDGVLLSVVDDAIILDSLPAAKAPHQIGD